MKLEEEIRELYNGVVLEDMGANNHELWLQMYRGEYPYLSSDTVSLNLACTIATELARTATLEFKSEVTSAGSKTEELNKIYQLLIEDIRKLTEYGLALGSIIIKPLEVTEGVIAFDYATPDLFIPLEVDANGELKRVVFISRLAKRIKNKTIYYTKLEEHNRGNEYKISNRAFESGLPTSLGKEIFLQDVEEWAGIEEEVILEINGQAIDYNLFGYFKNPQANNLDLKSPLGVSCFSRATSLIQDADEQYSRILWEYESKETAIDVDETMLKLVDDRVQLPARQERIFRKLNTDEGNLYQVYSPEIRDDSLFNGLNQILKKIEDACGLSRGMLSEQDIQQKTATEIKKTNQRLYSTVADIQKALQAALEDTIRAVCYWLDIDYDKIEISFDFDDSVIVDSKEEQEIALNEYNSDVISREEYLRRIYNMTEEQINDAIPAEVSTGYGYEEIEME